MLHKAYWFFSHIGLMTIPAFKRLAFGHPEGTLCNGSFKGSGREKKVRVTQSQGFEPVALGLRSVRN